MGENIGYGYTRDASLIGYITTLGGGALTLTDTNDAQTVNSPFTGPNTLASVSYRAAGGTSAAGNGAFVTVDGSGHGGAIAFGPGALSGATAGTLIIVWDVNFLDASRTAQETTLTNNLIAYLAAPTPIQTIPAGCTNDATTCTGNSANSGQYLNTADQTCAGFTGYGICTNCTACDSSHYMTGKCAVGATSDTVVCHACSGPCGANETMVLACSTTADRVCAPCPIGCRDGQYRTDWCGCLSCSGQCPVGKYEATACSAVADRTCAACSGDCPAGTTLVSACTPQADRVCARIEIDAAVPSGPDAAPDSPSGTAIMLDAGADDTGIDSGIDSEIVLPVVDADVDTNADVSPIITNPDTQLDLPLPTPDTGLDVILSPDLGHDSAVPDTITLGVDANVDTTVVSPNADASPATADASVVTTSDAGPGVIADVGAVATADSAGVATVDSGAAPTADAARITDPGNSSSSSCSCNLGAHSSHSTMGGIFVALGLLMTAIRRRRKV